MCCSVFLSVSLILQKSTFQNINAASTGILNEMSTRASGITKPALTLSILFPTSIFTRSFLVQYVSSSLSQLSSFEKVSWRVTSYTAAKQKHMIRRARTLFTHNITKCTCRFSQDGHSKRKTMSSGVINLEKFNL